MIMRIAGLAVAAVAVVGCATVSNTLSVDDVKGFKLASVDVSFAPDAHIWWGDAERAYASTQGVNITQSESLANTPEAKAFVRARAAEKVRAAMQKHLGGELTGGRPVRVQVKVKTLQIASMVQRVVIGGGHSFSADVTVVDTKTGASLASYSAIPTGAIAGTGVLGVAVDAMVLDDPANRVIDNFAMQYANWLLKRGAEGS
jgi:hypothetical protein